jgi:hypothetical protein
MKAKPPHLRSFFLLGCLGLTACGTSEISRNANETYTVSAQFGSVNGSWRRASIEANQKAFVFCEGRGEKAVVIAERQDGIWGFSPQRAEVNFTCGKSGPAVQQGSTEDRVRALNALLADGLITPEQHTAQLSRILSAP